MRGWAIALALAASLTLAACGQGGGDKTADPKAAGGTLHIYNWSD